MKNLSANPKEWIEIPKLQINFTDLMVDFFGCLIPGFVFFIFLSLLFFSPILLSFIFGHINLSFSLLKILDSFNFEFVLFVLLASYIMGHIFYRMDPKKPDIASYWFNRDKLLNDGPVKERFKDNKFLILQDIEKFIEQKVYPYSKFKNIEDYKTSINIEYPYSHLVTYLKDRGFSHLAALVPWSGKNYNYRSKHFINSLKIRLALASPNNYSQIARNEAHIRLMSSVWYLTRTLRYLSILSGLLTLFILIKSLIQSPKEYLPVILNNDLTLVLILVPLVLFLIFRHLNKQIIRFFHYQRIREIIYVLETAFFLHKNGCNIFVETESYRKTKKDVV